jgi:hypothetical protein
MTNELHLNLILVVDKDYDWIPSLPTNLSKSRSLCASGKSRFPSSSQISFLSLSNLFHLINISAQAFLGLTTSTRKKEAALSYPNLAGGIPSLASVRIQEETDQCFLSQPSWLWVLTPSIPSRNCRIAWNHGSDCTEPLRNAQGRTFRPCRFRKNKVSWLVGKTFPRARPPKRYLPSCTTDPVILKSSYQGTTP